MIDFKGSQFEKEIILWRVRWCVAYPIRDRRLEEMMSEQGDSNTKPTAKRREEVHQECRQHEAKSAAAAVSGIRGALYRCFLARGGFGRSPPVAKPRVKWNDTFRKEHNMSNNT
jgi:hypothetical protein